MNDAARAREIMDAIETILLEDWDPIGVKDERLASARQDYWPYVGGVYRLLASRATELELATHLKRIEAERMGLGEGSASSADVAARKLTALDVRVHGGPAA
jgi:hypothetical protein